MAIVLVEEDRQLQQVAGVELDEEEVDRERHRVDEHDVARPGAVPEPALVPGHVHAHGQPEQQGHAGRHEAEAHGIGNPRCDDLRDRHIHAVDGGSAQVPLGELPVEGPHLQVPGIQEPHLLQDRLALGGIQLVVALAEIALDGQQAHEEEDDGDHQEERHHGLCESFQRVLEHRVPGPPADSIPGRPGGRRPGEPRRRLSQVLDRGTTSPCAAQPRVPSPTRAPCRRTARGSWPGPAPPAP